MLDISGLPDVAAAQAASRDCPYCSGFGLATVYRAGYDGRTVEDDCDVNGKPFRRLMVTTDYCVCAAGRWIMANHQTESREIFARMNDLWDLLDYGKGSCWSPNDPTLALAKFDPSDVPDWKAFRRLIASGPVTKSAREALREPAPAVPSWKSLPPATNVPESPVEVPDEELADVPF